MNYNNQYQPILAGCGVAVGLGVVLPWADFQYEMIHLTVDGLDMGWTGKSFIATAIGLAGFGIAGVRSWKVAAVIVGFAVSALVRAFYVAADIRRAATTPAPEGDLTGVYLTVGAGLWIMMAALVVAIAAVTYRGIAIVQEDKRLRYYEAELNGWLREPVRSNPTK